jgi:pimeloyl-ACP methyl ester carboxylesterase
MTFTDGHIELDGARTRLRRGGNGAPLLYLHGASGAPVVLPFMEKLAQRFEVLVPEHPGYGKSDEPPWLENIHDMAYFYLDLLKHLNLRNVTVVGSSMGGWIAMEMAVRDTSRMRALVLSSPVGVAAPGMGAADTFLMSPEDLVRNLFFDPKLAEARLAQPEDIDVSLKNRHTTARLAWEPRYHDPFLPKWLHRIDVPVKLVWGREDRIVPVALSRELKKLIPRAEIHILENCGHLPHVEKADEFVEILCR